MRNIAILCFIIIALLQCIILYALFNRSLSIEGDIVIYLEIVRGIMGEGDLFEPGSLLLFNIIGYLPSPLHFSALLALSIIFSVFESWQIFKLTSCSLLWVVFFLICIMPFAHAINLRTGFGIFFIFLFLGRPLPLFFVTLFHASLAPLALGARVRLSIQNILLLSVIIVLILLVLLSLVYDKLFFYYGFLAEGDSKIGLIIEISMLMLFSYLFLKRYEIESKIAWKRILIIVILIAAISLPLAIISSRFVTLVYLILILTRIDAGKLKNRVDNLSVNSLLFFTLFFALLLFRAYRVLTMFGYISKI